MIRDKVEKWMAHDVLAAKNMLESMIEEVNSTRVDDIRNVGFMLSILAELYSDRMRWFHSVRICRDCIRVELDSYTFGIFINDKKAFLQFFIDNDPDLNFAFFNGLAEGMDLDTYKYEAGAYKEKIVEGEIMAYSEIDAGERVMKICMEQYRMSEEQLFYDSFKIRRLCQKQAYKNAKVEA